MLLHEESACQLYRMLSSWEWLCYNDSSCCPWRTKRLLSAIGRVKHAAVISCRRLVLDAILRDLLNYLWRVGLIATSPIRWEAHLLWMSHGAVSPAWGCSVHSQIIGKLGHCTHKTSTWTLANALGPWDKMGFSLHSWVWWWTVETLTHSLVNSPQTAKKWHFELCHDKQMLSIF